ncbi:MAG: PorV/PorQ family protein [Flavobacteriales bacterium]|nr:PorV/PorQ family protein [Flavobacteriales bacterium]
MKKTFALFGLLLFWYVAQSQSTGKYANEYLQIGVGARAFGMSNSVVSSTTDVTAGYWNPAGLVHLKNNIQVGYMHSNYQAGIGNYDYGGLAFKAGDNGHMGVSFIRMGYDGIPYTLDLYKNGQLDYDKITQFSAVDYGFLFSYGQKILKDGFSVGGNAKIIRRSAGNFVSAWGFGIDAAAMYQNEETGWNFGLTARDITSTFTAWNFNFTDAEKATLTQLNQEIPKNSLEIALPRLLAAASKKFKFDEYSILAEMDMDITTDGKRNTAIHTKAFSIDPHLGLEFGYANSIFLRGGVGTIQRVINIDDKELWSFQPNIGVGVALDKFSLDYAMANVASVAATNYSHVFSIRFNINSSEENSSNK